MKQGHRKDKRDLQGSRFRFSETRARPHWRVQNLLCVARRFAGLTCFGLDAIGRFDVHLLD